VEGPGESGEAHPRIGKLWLYFAPLYAGHLLALFGLLPMLDGRVSPVGLIVAGVGLLLLTVASVYLMMLLYRIWKLVIRESRLSGLQPSIDSPGKAIGFLFIPLFNFYWVFVAVGKLPRDLNALAGARDVRGTVPVGLGYAVAVLSVVSVIPFVGYVTSFIVSLVLMPVLVTRAVDLCGRISTRVATLGEEVAVSDVAVEPASIRNWSDLFQNRGANARVAVAFFLALVAGNLMWLLWYGSMSFSTPLFPTLFLADVAIFAVLAVAFVTVNTLVRRVWLLPPIWGFAWMVLMIVRRLIQWSISARFLEPDHYQDVLMPSALTGTALWGILFMTGLIVATRLLGVRIWSLPAGLVGSYLVWLAIWEPLGSVVFDFEFGIDITNLAINIVNEAIMGIALYLGFLLQARTRKIEAPTTG
jgi:hypothetical protein